MDKILVDGELILYGYVGELMYDGGFTSKQVIDALAEVNGQDINVRINSFGGYVHEGVAIYNALKAHTGKITVYIDAAALSSASLIAMAGDEILMRDGSFMMIHDPLTITIGDAKTHRKEADVLDLMAENLASIYAQKSGKSEEEVRSIMVEEVWYDADLAIENGFATGKDEQKSSEIIASFDYTKFKNAPEAFKSLAQNLDNSVKKIAACAANPNEVKTMPNKENTLAAADKEVTPLENKNNNDGMALANAIMQRCITAKLTLQDTNEIMKACKTLDEAKDEIINRVAKRDEDVQHRAHGAVVTHDSKDKFVEGVTKSLLAKGKIEGGEVNEFSALTLREVARASLEISGHKFVGQDPLSMVGKAFTMASGQHSTSDFANILANVASKSMMKGYAEAEETFDKWTSKGSLSDFKSSKRVDIGAFGNLPEVIEGSDYTYGTIGDTGENIQLATYGKLFAITRQAIINDDLSAFTRIPLAMGRAAKRTIGNLVYAVLTSNPALADGVTLFHASHANLVSGGGTALAVASLDAGRAAMAKQKSGVATLNVRPSYLIVPVALEGTARQLITSQTDPTANASGVANKVAGLAEVISDARLDAVSTTAWYLAANPNLIDTIEVAYLNGIETPALEEKQGWSVDGVEFKVRMDAAVKPLKYQGLYKAAGA